MSRFVIGEATADAIVAVSGVESAAFGRPDDTRIVDAIRARFDLLVVPGNPRYCSRFGFEPAHPAGIEYQVPGFERGC